VAWRNSLSEYEKRMHRVLEYIDKHLDQPLDLGTLAEVAHFSPFHFHRLFSAWMAETLGDYLRRRNRVYLFSTSRCQWASVPPKRSLGPFGLGSAAHPPLGEHEKPSNALRIAILVR
jgi:hypothetical protein